MFFKPKRLHPKNDDIKAVLALLIESFAYMERRIDPPSSLNALTLETIRDHCKSEEVWICDNPPFGLYVSHEKRRLSLPRQTSRISAPSQKGFGALPHKARRHTRRGARL